MTADRPPPSAPAYRGLILRERDAWVVAADPDILILWKRVLLRIDKSELGQIRVTRTDEVDRLVQWLLDLHPLQMSARDAAELHRGAEAQRALGRIVQEMKAGEYVPTSTFTLALPPRDYQCVAADMWLRMKRLLLADDLGLGKTVSAIAFLSSPGVGPALVVGPGGSMPVQWRQMLDRFLPGLRIFTCTGQRPSVPTEGGWPDVVICPYHLLQYWGDVLLPRIRTIVFDEVQELRHPDTDKYRVARQLSERATYVLGMSATPAYNYGAEYFAVLDAIKPRCLGTWEEFDREHCVHGGERRKKSVKDTRAFGYYLDQSGLRLRRTRKDVGRELPPLTLAPTPIACDPAELRKISGRASSLAQVLLAQSFGKDGNFRKMQAASELDRLMRQATGIGKAPFVAEFLRILADAGESCLVGLHHRAVYDILVQQLDDFKPAVYSGGESAKEKQEALRRFKAKETPILLMGLRVGSAGIDGLQHACRTAVIAEPDWSPEVHKQFIGRIDRDGQPDPVTAYFLYAEDGSDPTVMDVGAAKRAQQVVISDPLEARRVIEQVDVNRAERLAEAHLARMRR